MLRHSLEYTCDTLGIPLSELEDTAVLVLPENVDCAPSPTDLYDTADSIELAKAFKSQGVSCKTAFDLKVRPSVKDRRGVDIWVGVIWLVQNTALPIALGVLSNWLTGKLRADGSDRVANSPGASNPMIHTEIRIEDTAGQSRIQFDGPVAVLLNVLAALSDDRGPKK
jgi:hypothetical protein